MSVGSHHAKVEKNLIHASEKTDEEGSNGRAVDIMDSGTQAVSRYMVLNTKVALNMLM